jgi:hypothetical protein
VSVLQSKNFLKQDVLSNCGIQQSEVAYTSEFYALLQTVVDHCSQPRENESRDNEFNKFLLPGPNGDETIRWHQCFTLIREFSNFNFSLLFENLFGLSNTEESGGSNLSNQALSSVAQVSHLLDQALALENSYLETVKNCRQKDANRGREIIPDYELTNVAGRDVMDDPVVKSAVLKAHLITELVEEVKLRFGGVAGKLSL